MQKYWTAILLLIFFYFANSRGQIVPGEGGSKTIVSYPQAPVRFPNNLKR